MRTHSIYTSEVFFYSGTVNEKKWERVFLSVIRSSKRGRLATHNCADKTRGMANCANLACAVSPLLQTRMALELGFTDHSARAKKIIDSNSNKQNRHAIAVDKLDIYMWSSKIVDNDRSLN